MFDFLKAKKPAPAPENKTELLKKAIKNTTLINLEDKKNIWVSEEIDPGTINNAITWQNNYGKLQNINKLYDQLLQYNDNVANAVDVRKEALKSKMPVILNELPDAQREYFTDFLEKHFGDVVDLVIEKKMKGFLFKQINWEMIDNLYHITDFIGYENQDIRVDTNKIKLFVDDVEKKLPEYKFITQYQGKGILQGLLKYYAFGKFALNNWASFVEIFGKPIRVGKYKPGASKTEKNELWEMIQNAGTDLAAMISENVILEFVDFANKATSADLFESLVKFTAQRETSRILGQDLTTTAQKFGTLAQAKVGDLVRKDILKGDARDCAKFLNELFSMLYNINFATGNIKVSIDTSDDVNLFERVQIDRVLANEIGVEFPENYFYNTYKVPKPEQQ